MASNDRIWASTRLSESKEYTEFETLDEEELNPARRICVSRAVLFCRGCLAIAVIVLFLHLIISIINANTNNPETRGFTSSVCWISPVPKTVEKILHKTTSNCPSLTIDSTALPNVKNAYPCTVGTIGNSGSNFAYVAYGNYSYQHSGQTKSLTSTYFFLAPTCPCFSWGQNSIENGQTFSSQCQANVVQSASTCGAKNGQTLGYPCYRERNDTTNRCCFESSGFRIIKQRYDFMGWIVFGCTFYMTLCVLSLLMSTWLTYKIHMGRQVAFFRYVLFESTTTLAMLAYIFGSPYMIPLKSIAADKLASQQPFGWVLFALPATQFSVLLTVLFKLLPFTHMASIACLVCCEERCNVGDDDRTDQNDACNWYAALLNLIYFVFDIVMISLSGKTDIMYAAILASRVSMWILFAWNMSGCFFCWLYVNRQDSRKISMGYAKL